MNKLSNGGKVVIVAVVAAVLIVLILVYGVGSGNLSQNAPTNTASDTVGAASSVTSETTGGTTGTAAAKSAVTTGYRAPANPAIHFITPVANDLWIIGTDNPIAWDKVGNITGSLSLIDATTGQTIGVILPSVGSQQTSFTWNVRDVFLNETSPLKKDVVPGTYEIRLAYNGNDIAPATSPKFTIVASSSTQ